MLKDLLGTLIPLPSATEWPLYGANLRFGSGGSPTKKGVRQ